MFHSMKRAWALSSIMLPLICGTSAAGQVAKKPEPIGSRIDATGKTEVATDKRTVKRLRSRIETRIDNRIGGSGARKPSDATAAPK